MPFELIDLRTFAPADREAELQRLARAEAEEPFNLAEGRLLRVKLLTLDEQEFLLLLTVHHITLDGWSISVLRRELTALYQSLSEQRPSPLPSLPIQFADFAMRQAAWLESVEFTDQLKYWKQKLAGAPEPLNLPASYQRPDAPTGKGGEVSRRLPVQFSTAIKALSKQEDATLFMTLLAAFQALLSRYGGQDDILIGAPLADRTMVQTEDLIGPFMNTLVFRTDLSGNPTFRELLARVRETSLDAYAHQDVPFEKLVEELHPQRGAGISPLFQVMFALQNLPASEIAIDGLTFAPHRLSSVTAKFDLTLGITEEPDGLRASFEYSADLFAPAAIERMANHFQALLEEVVSDPARRLADLLNQELFETPAPASSLQLSEPRPVVVYQAPSGPIEERLAQIWREVLRLERVGVNDNFFELGGHSLLATQVVSRIRRAFQIDLPLRSFFKTSTIAGLAEAVYQNHAEQTEDDELGAMLAELQQLSDEEARRRFAEET